MGNVFEFLRANFWHIMPILVAGAIALAIVLEWTRALFFVYPMRNQKKFFEKIRDYLMADRMAEAIAYCDQHAQKPAAQIAREGLLRSHQPEIIIEDGLSLAVSEAGQKIQKRTAFVATIANVSTLLGLFGTIVGLVDSFNAVGSASAQERAAKLAAGISTAMNATMMGLAVAIPCMIAFSYLMNKTNRLNSELDQAAVRILDLIRQRFYASDLEAPTSKPPVPPKAPEAAA